MKPYSKVLWNTVKYNIIKYFWCKNLEYRSYLLLGYNTHLSLCRTSYIKFGKNVISDGRCVIILDENASVEIGDRVYFNEGLMLSAKKYIKIGSGCQFGPNVKIFDNNHKFNREQGVLADHESEEIVIGKNCWIASNVTILKGVHIGDNCVIGAGCTIKENIPSSSIVTQKNTIVVKQIENKE